MQSRCAKHLFEGAEDRCGKCGFEYCGECLVYAFGPKKPPLCIPCAVAAAGIRAAAGNRPAYNKTEMKRLQKERSSGFKRFRRDRTSPPEVTEPGFPAPPTPVAPLAPATSEVPPVPVVPMASEAPPVPAAWPIHMAEVDNEVWKDNKVWEDHDVWEDQPATAPVATPPHPPVPRFASDYFEDDEFTTDPAYVDPAPAPIRISGL